MTPLTYDLHIHSCLSPCGDDDMTPFNIAGMCALKGLDAVALTDHNTCRNCRSFLAAAKEYGLLAIPGAEVTTAEEVHAVCLFATLEAAMDFDRYLYGRLNKVKNREDLFGRQILYDETDNISGYEENLLINSTDIPFDSLWDIALSYGGVMFPAHLDKQSNSLLSNLGFVPPDSRFRTAELMDLTKLHSIAQENPYLKDCRIISSSDAHTLGAIREPDLTLPASEATAEAVIRLLRGREDGR